MGKPWPRAARKHRTDSAGSRERRDIIEQRGNKWVLLSHEGKVLGEHATKEEAEAQESAVNIAKAREAGHHIPKKDCFRVDAGELKKPVKMANGWMKFDAYLTRTGIFLYREPDGSERRELRVPEEVFRKDSLDSFALVPVTDDHPPEFLTAENTRKYARGSLGEAVTPSGKFIQASGLVTDAELLKKMEAGEAVEVSCGYICDLDETPGVTADGQKYDGIQRNIRGNHVAIVDRGRAGREARVRMDSSAAAMLSIVSEATDLGHSSEEHTVRKIKIDGVEYDAGSEQAAAAQAAFQAKLDSQAKAHADAEAKRTEELKAAKDAAEKAQAKADAEGERAKKLDAELKEAPKKIASELKARMNLEAQAKDVLGKKAKLDALSDREVKLAVLAKLDEDFDGKGRSDAYVDGRFDAALELAKDEDLDGGDERDDESEDDEEDGIDSARRVIIDEEDAEEAGSTHGRMSDKEAEGEHEDSQTAYEAMVQRGRNAWKNAFKSQA